jgi:hypothetical protein
LKNVSGKLVIITIVAVALAAAGTSWWFRYSATHRAAEFWGPKEARLIRDAPVVQFWVHEPPGNLKTVVEALISTDAVVDPATVRDIDKARGLVHLRNALLDDRSFNWPPTPPKPGVRWGWVLSFRNDAENEGTVILLSSDCKQIASLDRPDLVLSSEPIAVGLSEMIAEFLTMPTAEQR